MTLLLVLLQTLSVLAVGNSFSMDALEQELYPIAQEKGIDLYIGNMYIGGCSLEQHLRNAQHEVPAYSYRQVVQGVWTKQDSVTLREVLQARKWDVVTLQQVSGESGFWASYTPFLQALIDTIRTYQPQAKLLWHQTWAYAQTAQHPDFPRYRHSQQVMFDSIQACTQRVMRDYSFDDYIPCGQAVQNGRQTKLGDTFCRDGYHMNYTYGRYLVACTWFETLTGFTSVGLKYKPAAMTKKERRITQRAAHKAVQTR